MKRLLLGLALGVLLGATAHGEERAERPEKLVDAEIKTVSGNSFTIPERYGRLAGVVLNSEVHCLYFEDGAGAIRVVLLGARGSAQRARNPLQLLSPDVFLIKRGADHASSH